MDEVSSSKEVEVKPLEMGEKLLPSVAVRWRPRQLVFSPYAPTSGRDAKTQSLRVAVRRPLVSRLTKDIVETYQTCNPQFQFSEELNPKRFLTSPSSGVLNDGYDNANSDLILSVNFSLVKMENQRRYIVKEMLGQGTFGQVAKCWVAETKSFVAVKIIKNQPAYYQQALVEVSILTTLNKKFDPEDKHHIVRIYDYFVFQRHLCIVFELLDTNLYELIKLNHFRGLSLSIVQLFSKQILHGLALMKEAGIIHCDLKPENILLCTSVKPAQIKIIDFGSACMEDRTVYSYIQSRYYRSPEVLLGYHYTTAIDMWSFGCIVAELYLGLPMFPGASEFDLLRRMIKILGGQPPDYVLKEAKNTNKFFKCVGSVSNEESGQIFMSRQSAYQALTEEEYESRESKKPSIGKEYFNHMNLETIVRKYPYRKNLAEEDILKESQVRLALIDFLRGLVEFDPAKRWSPMQASKHPFVTGEPFTCPYKPAPETPRVAVLQNLKVDHHPAGGHWFAAGLSPNIPGGNRLGFHNSPHYQVVPYAHAGSYGSLGSHGSYNDGAALGSSYGSYGDNSNMPAFYSPVGPSGMNIHARGGVPILGTSPDARRRIIHNPHGNGLGVSPSGNFAPMSLGTSPSQFTPPSAYGTSPSQFTPPSTYGQVSGGSPGQYGPSSPARGSSHGSPLGKMAAAGQFHRRKNWVPPGSLQSQESSSSHRKGHFTDGNMSSQPEVSSPLHGSPSHIHQSTNAASWRLQQGCSSSYSPSHSISSSSTPGSSTQLPHLKGANHEEAEASNSLPGPGDWDPNYSEELLLQEDSSEVSGLESEFSKGMRLSHTLIPTETSIGVKRFSGTLIGGNASSSMTMQRPNIQSYSYGEVASPSLDLHGGYMQQMTKPPHFLPHIQQNSPSRLGQQPGQQFHYGRSVAVHGADWNHLKVQAPPSSYGYGGPRSPGNNGVPWGRHGNHPVASMPPTSRGRKDYGRIS